MEKEIIVHIGLAKTGTTFLQQKVFPYLNLYFEGASYTPTAKNPIFKELIHCSSYSKNPIYTDENIFNNYKKQLWEYINKNTNNKTHKYLFSFEGLAGSYTHNCNFRYENMQLIKKLFPNAKILFIFRRQDSFVEPKYFTCIY